MLSLIVRAVPQSEVLAKIFQEIGEKCGELWAIFADFHPSISRENSRKNVQKKSSTFAMVHKIEFFTLQLWGLRGPSVQKTHCNCFLRFRGIHQCQACFQVPCRLRSQTMSFCVGLGQKICRTKASRIFRIFVPNFAPNFAPNFPRIFRGLFVLRFVGDRDQKKFTQNPCHFSMPNFQANTKNIHKILLESRQSNVGVAKILKCQVLNIFRPTCQFCVCECMCFNEWLQKVCTPLLGNLRLIEQEGQG